MTNGVRIYVSRWERKGFGFYSGSNVAGEGPDRTAEDDILKRMQELIVKAEHVRLRLQEATERRRALNDRLRVMLEQMGP